MQVDFGDDDVLTVDDSFHLANPVINTLINGQQEIFQLINKRFDEIKLQYCGTVVRVSFVMSISDSDVTRRIKDVICVYFKEACT